MNSPITMKYSLAAAMKSTPRPACRLVASLAPAGASVGSALAIVPRRYHGPAPRGNFQAGPGLAPPCPAWYPAWVQLPVVRASVRRDAVADADWHDWRWQLRHMLTTAAELGQVIDLSPAERAGLAASQHLFRVGLTPYYASLMDPAHEACPVRMQALPRALEADVRAEELRDPLGEDTHNPAPSVIHKYPRPGPVPGGRPLRHLLPALQPAPPRRRRRPADLERARGRARLHPRHPAHPRRAAVGRRPADCWPTTASSRGCSTSLQGHPARRVHPHRHQGARRAAPCASPPRWLAVLRKAHPAVFQSPRHSSRRTHPRVWPRPATAWPTPASRWAGRRCCSRG
jgi:hypothetical protein